MNNEILSLNQIKKCRHALGLTSVGAKKSFRNYYNTGPIRDGELDELVNKKIMTRRQQSKEMGGFYYFITDYGVSIFQEIFGKFKVKHD